MTQFDTLSISLEDHVARLDLNRPEKANSFDAAMWSELKQAYEELDQSKDVRVVVLGGQGKHFTTGIDLDFLGVIRKELNQYPDGLKQERLHSIIVELQNSINAVENCRKPVLAAVQGFCMGAGVDLASACDMRFATAATRFSVKEVDLAIVADVGSLQRLPRIVGEGRARELAFTGRIFKGEEAQAIGFVNRLFQNSDALNSGVVELAKELAKKSPMTLRGIKETMNYSRDHSVAQGLNYVALRNAAMLLSQDMTEAAAAFKEKRLPEFKDR